MTLAKQLPVAVLTTDRGPSAETNRRGQIEGSVNVKSLLCGLLIGGMAMYIAFQSHIVQTDDGLVFVPKQPPIPLSDTYADTRGWNESDWNRHPRLLSAMRNADRFPEESEQVNPEQAPGAPVPLRGPIRQPGATSVSYPPSTQLEPTQSVNDKLAGQTGRRGNPQWHPAAQRLADAAEDIVAQPAQAAAEEIETFEDDFMQQLDRAFAESRRGMDRGLNSPPSGAASHSTTGRPRRTPADFRRPFQD